MKKELKKAQVKKLRLQREALRQLDPRKDADFLKIVAGNPMSPAPHCVITVTGC